MFDRLLPFLAIEKAQKETRQQVDDAHMHTRHAEDMHRTGGDIVFAHLIGEFVVVTQQNGRRDAEFIVAQPAALQRRQQDITETIREGIDGVGIVHLQVNPVLVLQIGLPRNALAIEISPIVKLAGVTRWRHLTHRCRNGDEVAITQGKSRIRLGKISHHLTGDGARRRTIAKLVLQIEHSAYGVGAFGRIVINPSHIITCAGFMAPIIIPLSLRLVHTRQRHTCHDKIASHDGTENPMEAIAFQHKSRHGRHRKKRQGNGHRGECRQAKHRKADTTPNAQSERNQHPDEGIFGVVVHR